MSGHCGRGGHGGKGGDRRRHWKEDDDGAAEFARYWA